MPRSRSRAAGKKAEQNGGFVETVGRFWQVMGLLLYWTSFLHVHELMFEIAILRRRLSWLCASFDSVYIGILLISLPWGLLADFYCSGWSRSR